MTEKNLGGRPPLIHEDVFIKSWNRNNGNASKVAKELNIKYNSAWVRGSRLLKKRGIKGRVMNTTFNMNYEKLESER